jgi:hypothetical protein
MKKIIFFLLLSTSLQAQQLIENVIQYSASKLPNQDSLWKMDVINAKSNPQQIVRYNQISTAELQSYFLSQTISSYQAIGVQGYKALFQEVMANKHGNILEASLGTDYDTLAVNRYTGVYDGVYQYQRTGLGVTELTIKDLSIFNANRSQVATIKPLSPNYYRLTIKSSGDIIDMYSEDQREWLGKDDQTGNLYYFKFLRKE